MQGKGNATRLALRAAMLGSQIEDNTKDVVTSVLEGIPDSSPSTALVGVTIGAAVLLAKTSYDAIKEYNQDQKEAADLFEQDYKAGTVTCFVANELSDRKRFSYQLFLHNFIELLQTGDQGYNSPLLRRAGISYALNVSKAPPAYVNNKPVKGISFSIISTAKVVFAGLYECARKEDLLLDTARNGSDMLLRAKLRAFLAKIHAHRQDSVLKQGIHPTAYLHELDVISFMILTFANLLINLQHPGDLNLNSNMSLTAESAKALCAEVKRKIDTILLYDKHDTGSPWAYLNSMQEKELFFEFLTLIKREIEELEEGYQSKILNQLDWDELIKQSQGVLQELNELWHRIIYMEKPGTESVCLLYAVRALSNDLDVHPQFWSELPSIYKTAKVAMPIPAQGHPPFSTVMDLLGLIFSLDDDKRQKVLKAMKDKFPTIRRCLKNIKVDFVDSLDGLKSIQNQPAQAFLMNLIAISTESYPTFIQEPHRVGQQLSLREQFSNLNTLQISKSTTTIPVYTWSILEKFAEPMRKETDSVSSETRSVFGKLTTSKPEKERLSAETLKTIQDLLQTEYQFLDTLRIVYTFQDLLENNRNLMRDKKVVLMVKKVFKTLEEKMSKLIDAMQVLYDQVDQVDKISTEEKDWVSNKRRGFILDVLSGSKALLRARYTQALIQAAIKMVESVEFSRRMEQEATSQVQAVYYASHEQFLAERDQLLSLLQLPLPLERQGSVIPAVYRTSESKENKIILTDQFTQISDDVSIEGALPGTPLNHNLRFLFIIRIMRAISAFLLIAGLLMLLSLTYGAPYLPIIAALTTQQMATGMVVGGIGATVGGGGLFLSVFFKPRLEKVGDAGVQNTMTKQR